MAMSGSYPAHPVTFVSAAPPGGGWYQTCEHTVRALRKEGLVPVEVRMEERQGGLKVLEEMATERKGDAYTLAAFSPGLTLQILMRGSRYSYADITPIAATSTDYGVLVVPTKSDISNLHDLVTALRRDPQAVPVGGGSPTGMMHHGMIASVAVAAGLDPSHIRYEGSKGVSDATSALLGGQTAVGALGAANILDELDKGTMRALAVLSEERLPGALEGVPTAAEQGIKVTFPMWRGFYAPPGISAESVTFWGETLKRLTETQAWSQVLQEMGWFPFLLTGQDFAQFLEEDTRRYRAIVGGASS